MEGNKEADELIRLAAEKKKYFTHENLSALGFNTGGYTGEWTNGDTDGRLALLHQKELVLNREDTANILKAVDILRTLDSNVLSRIASMVETVTSAVINDMQRETETLQQEVKIDAHFPNVSSANEIQEAFNQLITEIGQQMYRNKK
jgi:hypothetical protein